MPERLAEPALLIAASVAAYVAWTLLDRGFSEATGQVVRSRSLTQAAALAVLLGSVAYFVGAPYLALISGVLDLRVLGLTGGDPVVWLPLSAALSLVTWALMASAWRSWSQIEPPPTLTLDRSLYSDAATRSVAAAVLQQSHLAFYRGAIAMAAGTYAGVFAGLGLVVAERLAGAAIRRRWPGGGSTEGEVLLFAAWSATSLLFLATNSLPACLLAHAAIEGGIRWYASRRASAAPDPAA